MTSGVGRGHGAIGPDDGRDDDGPDFSSPQARAVSGPDLLDSLAHARPGDVLVVRKGTDVVSPSALRTLGLLPDGGLVVPGSIHAPAGQAGVSIQTVVGFEVSASGTPDQPVTIAAEEPGGFKLQGVSMLVTGSHVRVWGASLEEGMTVAAGASIKILRHAYVNPPGAPEGCAVMIAAPDSVVGYCSVIGQRKWGVRCRAPDARNIRVHHCSFGKVSGPEGANGYEVLQLGLGNNYGNWKGGMLAEYNRFDGALVDLETISIKSGSATVRFNTLVNCRSISHRHGHDGTIVGNWLDNSDIILLQGPGICFFNHGERGAKILPVWGNITGAAADAGVHGYPACDGWRLGDNPGCSIQERNPGGRTIKPRYAAVKPPGPVPPVVKLTPAQVGPHAP